MNTQYYNIDANASGNFDQYQYSGSGVPSINTPVSGHTVRRFTLYPFEQNNTKSVLCL